MLNYFLRKISCVTVVVLVILCALSATAGAQEKGADNSKTPTHIAVISFQSLTSGDGQGNTVSCPVCGVSNSSGKVSTGAENIVEEIFVDKLRELKWVELIPLDKVQDVYKRSVSESLKEPLLNVFKKVGKELGADVLAVGYIYRYIERVGYGYGSEHPASVAFEIHLIKIADGKVIWRGFFDKTQKSLMEDVFQISSFIKGGGKWLTVRQLTKQGMDKVFETFPRLEH